MPVIAHLPLSFRREDDDQDSIDGDEHDLPTLQEIFDGIPSLRCPIRTKKWKVLRIRHIKAAGCEDGKTFLSINIELPVESILGISLLNEAKKLMERIFWPKFAATLPSDRETTFPETESLESEALAYEIRRLNTVRYKGGFFLLSADADFPIGAIKESRHWNIFKKMLMEDIGRDLAEVIFR